MSMEEGQIKIAADLFEHGVRIEKMRGKLCSAQLLVSLGMEQMMEGYKGTAYDPMLEVLDSLYNHLGRLSILYESCSNFIGKTDEVMHLCDSLMAKEITDKVLNQYRER